MGGGWFTSTATQSTQQLRPSKGGRQMDSFYRQVGVLRRKTSPVYAAQKNLKGVAAVLNTDQIVDWKLLTENHCLQFLDLECEDPMIDLSSQHQLRSLSLIWGSKIILPPPSDALQSLMLRGYSPNCEDLSTLGEYTGIEHLSISQGRLKSLNGVQMFPNLKSLCVRYEKRLHSVSDLVESRVECAVFDHCPKLVNIEVLSRCRELKELFYLKCPPLEGIGFLNEMEKLKVFTFTGTNILNGNLRPLFRLEYSGFDDRKHYSHSYDQVRAIQLGRGNK
jgi:protein phosphatase 1 regulatory subunit 7